MTLKEFFNKYGDDAKRAGEKAGVNPAYIFAHWAHETGLGKNTGTTKNNLAGILDYPGSPYGRGGKGFSSMSDFVDYYSGLITKSRYSGTQSAGNVQDFARALKNGGYATDPNYVYQSMWFSASNYYNQHMGNSSAGASYDLPVEGKITSGYGERDAPTAGASTFHKGIDISAKLGTAVKNLFGGTVVDTGYNSGLGNFVKLSSGEIFGHLSKISVDEGQKLNPGDIIGKVGSTGISTGNHLHYAIQQDGKYINPLDFIKNLGMINTPASEGETGETSGDDLNIFGYKINIQQFKANTLFIFLLIIIAILAVYFFAKSFNPSIEKDVINVGGKVADVAKLATV
jgi:murein DD-endopeptidase MepM/ murein hydrolase activator NlpD